MSFYPMPLASDFDPASDEQWRELVVKTLGGKDFDRAMTAHTHDGIAVKALYTAADSEQTGTLEHLRQGWDICQAYQGSAAGAVNRDILTDLEGGVSSLLLHMENGACPGIPLNGLVQTLAGVHLNMAAVHLAAGEEFEAASKALVDVWDTSGTPPQDVRGTLGIDPIGTLAGTGRLLTQLSTALERAAQIAATTSKQYPKVRAFMVDTHPYHEAGASEAQELAVMLATGVAYLRAMEASGMPLRDAAGQIAFTLAADADMYLTVAKFRAARRLWGQVLNACGVRDVPMMLHGTTATRMYSVRDPWVNILRGTLAVFGAGIGGADAVSVLPFDAAIGIPGSFGRRIARNIQVILQEESHLDKVMDPAAGAYAFESLTNELSDMAWNRFQAFESAGDGFIGAVKAGEVQADIAAQWAKRCKDIANRRQPLTGVSEFPSLAEKAVSAKAWPSVAACKPAGEQIDAPLVAHRYSEAYERLRDLSDTILAASGRRPAIFLANIGSAANFTARATFAKNFFEAGGVETVSGAGTLDMAELADTFRASSARVAILCSSDPLYIERGAEALNALLQAGAQRVYIAGKPENLEQMTRNGLFGPVLMSSDLLATLSNLYELLGDAS